MHGCCGWELKWSKITRGIDSWKSRDVDAPRNDLCSDEIVLLKGLNVFCKKKLKGRRRPEIYVIMKIFAVRVSFYRRLFCSPSDAHR